MADVSADFFPEWLEPAACRLTLVYGPPGSGKSSYVRAHRGRSDEVIDLNEIMAEMSREAIYQAPEDLLTGAVRERNRRLARLKAEAPGHRVWFITEGAGKARREWWEQKLKPCEIVFLAVSFQECLRRIYAEERPDTIRDRQANALRQWWIDNLDGK